jgi:anaerobic selenocysteine-containing dehydrogenase
MSEVLGKRQGTQREFDRVRRSTCANCPSGCGVKVFLKSGSIVDIVGDEEHPANKGSFCPKGLLSYLHQRNPSRIVRPLLRPNRREPLKPVSWAEAIDFAARRLGETAEETGREGCYIHSTSTSPFGHRLGGTLFAREYGTPHGPWRFKPRALGPEGAVAKMFGIAGSRLLTNSPRDWSNSQCIVIYGCDPAATDPMTIGPVIDARERGMEVIVIDDRTTVTATKASYALRVRPGTESIAMRGILRLLIDNEWVDEEFVREATNGVESLRSELADFPAEQAARACGVPIAELRRVAEVIGKSRPVQVISGGWLAPERFCDEDFRLCAALVTLRGSIGIPGGGLNLLNASPFDCADWVDPGARAGQTPLSLEGVLLERAGKIGALFFEGDPCARMPGGARSRAALSGIPMIAMLGAYENSTTAHADVVFPMASWLEADGLLESGNGRALQWHHRVAAPPGECRSPLEFWTDLAAACGFGDRLPWSGQPSGSRDRAAAEWALRRNPWTSAVTVDLLDPERNPPGGILWPCTDAAQIEFEQSRFSRGDVRGSPNVLFQRNRAFPGATSRFRTSDGRVTLAPSTRAEPDALPPDALLLVPGIPVDHVEQYSGMALGRAPGRGLPTLEIHPRTAARFGLEEGDIAVVENELGSLEGVVSVSDVVSANTVGCSALPVLSADGASGLSAWALRAVPQGGLERVSYSVVSIRLADAKRRSGDFARR